MKDKDGNVIGEITYAQWWELIKVVCDLHWMARRYADGRTSYATSLFNGHTRFLKALGFPLNPTGDETIWARDTMGRFFDGLTDDEAEMGRKPEKYVSPPDKDELQHARDEVIKALYWFFGRDRTVHHQAWSLCSCLDCGHLYETFERWRELAGEPPPYDPSREQLEKRKEDQI